MWSCLSPGVWCEVSVTRELRVKEQVLPSRTAVWLFRLGGGRWLMVPTGVRCTQGRLFEEIVYHADGVAVAADPAQRTAA